MLLIIDETHKHWLPTVAIFPDEWVACSVSRSWQILQLGRLEESSSQDVKWSKLKQWLALKANNVYNSFSWIFFMKFRKYHSKNQGSFPNVHFVIIIIIKKIWTHLPLYPKNVLIWQTFVGKRPLSFCLPLSRPILTVPRNKDAIVMQASFGPPQKESITLS